MSDYKETIAEKAASVKQQRLMGMVRAVQTGRMKSPSETVSKLAASMKKKDVKDFASTKHEGLPKKKVSEEAINEVAPVVAAVGRHLLAKAAADKIKKMKEKREKEKEKEEAQEGYSFEIGSGHKSAQKQAKIRNLAKGTNNPNEKSAALKKLSGPSLPLADEWDPDYVDEGVREKAKEVAKKIASKAKEAYKKERKFSKASPEAVDRLQRMNVHKQDKYGPSTLKQRLKTGAEHDIDKEREEKEKKKKEEVNEGKKGLWDNIHAKRKRGERPAKPGEKDYPKTLNVEQKGQPYKVGDYVDHPTTKAAMKRAKDHEAFKKNLKTVGSNLSKKPFGEETEIEEGMTMKDFKANRQKNKRKEASADAEKRGHVGKEWHNTGRKYSPDEAKSRRAKMSDDDRRNRYGSAEDPDSEDYSHYPASKTKDPKKLRKQQAMGESAAWQRSEGKNKEGGLNEKGRKSYERENPGSDLKAPQPEGGPRKKSFCARMKGMKSKLTSSKTANDPDSRINKSLRKWKC